MKVSKEPQPDITEQEINELAEWLEGLNFYEVRALKTYHDSLPAYETTSREELNDLH